MASEKVSELQNQLHVLTRGFSAEVADALQNASDHKILFTEYFHLNFQSWLDQIFETQRELILAELKEKK